MPGSTEPDRVPIISPSSGVWPMDVSTERPSRTAVTEQPLPRWATTRPVRRRTPAAGADLAGSTTRPTGRGSRTAGRPSRATTAAAPDSGTPPAARSRGTRCRSSATCGTAGKQPPRGLERLQRHRRCAVAPGGHAASMRRDHRIVDRRRTPRSARRRGPRGGRPRRTSRGRRHRREPSRARHGGPRSRSVPRERPSPSARLVLDDGHVRRLDGARLERARPGVEDENAHRIALRRSAGPGPVADLGRIVAVLAA